MKKEEVRKRTAGDSAVSEWSGKEEKPHRDIFGRGTALS